MASIKTLLSTRAFPIVATLLVGLLGGHFVWSRPPGPSSAKASTSSAQSCQVAAPTTPKVAAGPPYHLGTTTPVAVSFGQSRDVRTVTRTLTFPADVHVTAQTPFAVSASDFVKSDGRVLDQSEIVVSAQATNDGRHIKVTTCVDPTAGREKASPGQYIGAINFDDPRIDAEAIPGVITLKYVSSSSEPVLLCGPLT